MSKDDSHKIDKLTKDTITNVVESLYAIDVFSDDDIKDEKSLKKALKQFVKQGGIGGFVIDHRESLLIQAKYFLQNSQFDYSKVFFATYFEHSINHLIEVYCAKRGISNQSKIEIIRNINIWGKLSWLLELIGLPKFNKVHLKTIKSLSDERNAFIHYKWNPESDLNKIPDFEKEKKRIDNDFDSIKKAVRYFKNYESRLIFKGKKES